MPRVLVIDDDVGTLETFRIILKLERFEVDVAAAALEGVELLHSRSYDVVLADLRLPDSSGLDVLKDLRRTGCMTPFLLMTAFGTIRSAVKAIQLGACDYLEKPLTETDLVEAVQKAIIGESTATRSIEIDTRTAELDGAKTRHEPGARHWKVIAALHVIQAHCSDPRLRLTTVAKELEISPEHLCRLLKRETGSGFGLQLHRFRTIRAKELLDGTKLAVKEVAWHSGYTTTTRLDHYFKKFFGVLPAVYRNRSRQGG
jgi:two-component system, response regulator YesN